MKDTKVIIARDSLGEGKLARVLIDAKDRIKLDIPGTGIRWYGKNLVRNVKQDANFEPIDVGAPARIVDIKGVYCDEKHLGMCGYVQWQERHMMSIDIGIGHDVYVEAGDLKKIPSQKLAWVVWNDRIIRTQVRLSTIAKGTASWVTANNYKVNDMLVYDRITPALDDLYLRTDEDKSRLKVTT